MMLFSNSFDPGTNSLKKEVLDFLRTAEDISFIDRVRCL